MDRYWDLYVTIKYSLEIIILSVELIISSAIKTYVHTQRQHASHLIHSPEDELTDAGAHLIRNHSPFSSTSQPFVCPVDTSTTANLSNTNTQTSQCNSSSTSATYTTTTTTTANTSNEQTPLLSFTSPAIPSNTPYYQMY